MTTLLSATLIDTKNKTLAIRKRKERIVHIDAQIAELEDKKGIIMHEISQLEHGD